jgi:hypothetical protein
MQSFGLLQALQKQQQAVPVNKGKKVIFIQEIPAQPLDPRGVSDEIAVFLFNGRHKFAI